MACLSMENIKETRSGLRGCGRLRLRLLGDRKKSQLVTVLGDAAVGFDLERPHRGLLSAVRRHLDEILPPLLNLLPGKFHILTGGRDVDDLHRLIAHELHQAGFLHRRIADPPLEIFGLDVHNRRHIEDEIDLPVGLCRVVGIDRPVWRSGSCRRFRDRGF